MSLVIRPDQVYALEAQRLRAFAGEVVDALAPVVADRPEIPAQRSTRGFALEQLERADTQGLKRRDELMAWSLCAMVHGPDFDRTMPLVGEILADTNYDRSMLLTLLAMHGLTSDASAT